VRSLCRLALAAGLLLAATGARAAGEVAEFLRARVEQIREGQGLDLGGASIASTRALPELYERRGFEPAWTRPGAPEALLEVIRGSTADGLDPRDYHLGELERRLAEPRDAGAEADLDLLLTDGLGRLVYHLVFGKVDPEAIDSHWNLAREIEDLDPALVIQKTVDAPSLAGAVHAFRPTRPFYRRLMAGLARYRAMEAMGPFEEVPPGASLEEGGRDPRVPALRRRLAAEGDLAAPEGSAGGEVFDAALGEGVRRFQRRHGLDPDGVVGPGTLAALNVPLRARIDQIRVNLERARWALHAIHGDFVLVDVTGFQLDLFEGDRPAWTTRVMVGKPYRKTPIFQSKIRYLVLNPSWTVPPGILEGDVLPALRRDPGYLARRNMRVIDARGREVPAGGIDWSRYASARGFPYQIRQDPGPTNALGRVKFMFPNEHAVYLHDTPDRSLFDRPARAFSSGCIRVEDPLELAVRLLRDPQRWSREALEREIASGRTQTVNLPQPIPVILLYWTAQADDQGTVSFRNDVYGRDAPILRALGGDFAFRRRPLGGRESP
jgi:murein L,D-transpeptidase YcbB/YkuD